MGDDYSQFISHTKLVTSKWICYEP